MRALSLLGWSFVLTCLALMWGAYPAALLLGLDEGVTVLSHGRHVSDLDILAAIFTLLARALQCVAAPVATASTLTWIALRRWGL